MPSGRTGHPAGDRLCDSALALSTTGAARRDEPRLIASLSSPRSRTAVVVVAIVGAAAGTRFACSFHNLGIDDRRGCDLMAIHIGTSGWSYPHWVGIVYPRSASSLGRLDAYVRRFATVEVNNTFYRWPKEEVFTTWHDRSPADFVFSIKASRGLTQYRKLNDPVPWLERMDAGLRRLGGKMGVLVLQLPPHFPYNPDRLAGFLEVAPSWWK
jgi:hypothetical protein